MKIIQFSFYAILLFCATNFAKAARVKNGNDMKRSKPELRMMKGKVIKVIDGVDDVVEDEHRIHNMCATRKKVMVPKMVVNIHKQWKYVLQNPFQQTIEYEECIEDSVCFADKFMPNNYKTRCKQQHVIIRLVVMNDDGTISVDQARVPGGCSCVYTKD